MPTKSAKFLINNLKLKALICNLCQALLNFWKSLKLKLFKRERDVPQTFTKMSTIFTREDCLVHFPELCLIFISFAALQEKMLQTLNKKVEEVYRNCIGDNEANIR